MRNKLFIFAAVLILILVVIFQKQLATHLKIALFITEEFPQIPVKPLGFVSFPPFHDKVELESKNGKIVGDLFIPVAPDKKGAVILAMGVKTAPKDKPLLIKFSDTLARLGYVVFWPRLEVLDKGQSLPEEQETFIESFKYVKNLEGVNPERVSYVGFSVGSSTSFVAASDSEISDNVHALVFFGGYFDIFDYLGALYKQTLWQPHQDAVDHAEALLKVKGVASSSAELARYSPKEFVSNFKAKIFILHDKSDTLVPYVESVKLYQALPREQVGAYHISDLFEHVQPNRPINVDELVKLYGFLYKVLSFI